MLTLLLAEAEIEVIPDKIALHPGVVTHAKRRGKRSRELILDSSMHHTAMKQLADHTRRGRPDLVHTFLLVALESIPNLEGELRVWVHTRDDRLLRFDPEIRLPKNYNRFLGLIEQVFETGCVPRDCRSQGKKPLIELFDNKGLPEVIADLRALGKDAGVETRVVVMSDNGREISSCEHFRDEAGSAGALVYIIGGFPEGDFSTDLDELAPDDIISIHKEKLKVWTVAAEILSGYRAGRRSKDAEQVSKGG